MSSAHRVTAWIGRIVVRGRLWPLVLVVGLGWLLWPVPVAAHEGTPQGSGRQADAILAQVAYDQRLDEQVPLDVTFRDETGQSVRLGDYFGDKPVVLTLSYYECPNLCPLVFDGLERSLEKLRFDLGDQYQVVTVSIDPDETPAMATEKKATYMGRYGRPGAAGGWHFLTGEHESIDRLAQAVGFRYAYDPELDEYAHAAGVVVLTPGGKIARYFYGVDFPANDLRLGLVEASANRIGSPVDQLLLRCYRYDPVKGKYDLVVRKVFQLAGAVTVLLLGGFLLVLYRYEGPQTPDVS